MKKHNTTQPTRISRTATRTRQSTVEVNGEPTTAYIQEKQIEEDGHERNITEITVGNTRRTYYEINSRELENRIDETATEEEDRIRNKTWN